MMKELFEISYDNLTITRRGENINNKSISLNITGDWSPKLGNISDILIEKKEKYYGDLLPYFKNSDLNILNLETVIDTQKRFFLKGAIKLIDKPEILNSLKKIHTHLVCMANNHIMDNGKKGLEETIQHLEKNDINYVGAGSTEEEIYKPFLYEKNEKKIAIINTAEGEEANEKYNNHCGASDIESYKIIDQIRKTKQKGYFVILIAHAGVEFIPTPPPHIQELFRMFVDEGADLVVSHHSHVPQGFEIYKNVPIFYSLGNFSMWKKGWRKNCYHSFFLNVEIVKNKLYKIELIPFEIKKDSLSLISKYKYSFKIIELNKLLLDVNEIWNEYIYSVNLKGSYIKEFLSIWYNYNKHKYSQINYHTTLSKRYIHLDSMRLNVNSKKKYKDILVKWQIIYTKSFLLGLINVFNPLFKVLVVIRARLGKLKRRFY
jgi:predicted nucleic acid-binding Zn finger protein